MPEHKLGGPPWKLPRSTYLLPLPIKACMARTSLCLSAGFNVFTFFLTLLTPLQSDVGCGFDFGSFCTNLDLFVPVEVVAVVIVVEVVVVVVAGPVTLLLSAESENIKFR